MPNLVLEKEPTPSVEALEIQLTLPSPDTIPDAENIPSEEHYGLSLSCIKAAGRLALEKTTSMEAGAVKQLRGEFDSCVFEGLSSDEEFGHELQVTKFDSWQVKDGRVMSGDGETPVSDLVKAGYVTSVRDANDDFRMLTQAYRDKNDLANALDVDAMVAGERDYNTKIIVSADPKEAMERDGEKFWYDKGYIKNQHYLQMYHWDGDKLLTAALSFKAEELHTVVDALRARGADVPEDISHDDLINHGLTMTTDAEEARKAALALREEASDSDTGPKQDTVDLVENRQSMETVFNEIYLPIAISSAMGKKTPRTAEIVSTFLQNSQYFDPKIQTQLFNMDSKQVFTDEDTRLMHQLAVYAAIERVRAELSSTIAVTDIVSSQDYDAVSMDAAVGQFINQMGNYIQAGSSAGRSYSSCGAALKLVSEGLKEFDMNPPQDVFGGKAEKEEEADDKGSLYFMCENRHLNRRPYGKTIPSCTTCGVSVAC